MFNFKRKISFKKNKKTDLLHCDPVLGSLKIKGVSENFLNSNELNMRYFLIGFIKFLFNRKKNFSLSDFYFIEVINSYNPKIVIGHDMTGRTFRIKNLIPNIISITYQLAFIFDNDKKFYKKNFYNKNTDFYLVYDLRSKKLMKQYVTGNYKIFGSFKASLIKIPKKQKKIKYDLLYISPFRSLKCKNKNNLRQNQSERKYLEVIKKYCFQNNKKICIALSSNREDKQKINQNDEKYFYKSIIPFVDFEDSTSINLLKKTKIIVSSLSNLGYELLLKKQKVLFLTSNKEKFKFFLNRNLPFVHYIDGTENFKSKISKLLLIKKNRWNKILYRYIKYQNSKKKLKLLITNCIR